MSEKVVLALSGGMDSTTLFADYNLRQKKTVTPVWFNYGSRHNQHEAHAVKRIINHYGFFNLIQVDLEELFLKCNSSSLLRGGKRIPHGHYQEETMRSTVVPGRNLIFLAVLASIAEAQDIDTVAYAAHAGDHFIYPDCRPEFVRDARLAIKRSTDGKVKLETPFITKTKSDILVRGLSLKVPFELTRTCYGSNAIACGKCGACQERLEAFELNGEVDPLEYESREIIPKTKSS